MIGANVLVKGTTNGTITDFDGNFQLSANKGDIIVISFIGFTAQELPATAELMNVVLKDDSEMLSEVVVIGYGSQKKKEVTGSVASIKAEDFNAGIKSSPVGLLQGKVAGLNIIKTSSDPTSTGYNIQIRGFSTLDKGAGTSPLFIVDGVPVSNIDNISPNEIASMDVLKDGSAAAIYGTRGTNGVIIITTKRGDSFSDVATTRVEYDGYVSTSMRNQDWCNDLKLRAGFGVTGNNLGSDLRSVAMLSNGGTFWYNGQYVYTYGVTQNVNPDLRWEKKYEYNLGLDYSFLNNRLYGSLDTYYRNTKDLLWDYEVPTPPYQYPTLLANAGEMNSYGVELAISGVPVKTKDWTWVTTPTIAWNRCYISKLSDPSKGFNYTQTTSGGIGGENGLMNTNTQILVEGQSIGEFYGYKFEGMKSDGSWVYSTPAGGYTSSPVEGHRQALGNAQPVVTFGWNNTVRWRNFDMALFFRGVIGNKILNVTRLAYGPQGSMSSNVFMYDIENHYIQDGKDRGVIYTNKTDFSNYYLEDGSYVKLDNITLGYNFKPKSNKFVENMRIYATGQNLLTLTKYSGQDPEVNTTNVWSAGIDYCDFYPVVANFLLGVNISLK